MKKKIVILGLALVLAFALGIGGTLAWLTDKTDTVTNTFTTAGIDITLTETFNTDRNNDGKNDMWQAKMIPGYTYAKDPKVTVEANSEDCYLFVKFEEKNNPSTYLTYTSNLTAANGWTQGEGTGEGKNGVPTDVWYRKVTSSTSGQSWNLLSGNTISVKDTVTKDNMNTAAAATLTYTAYASQLYKSAGVEFTAAEAWEVLNPTTPTT